MKYFELIFSLLLLLYCATYAASANETPVQKNNDAKPAKVNVEQSREKDPDTKDKALEQDIQHDKVIAYSEQNKPNSEDADINQFGPEQTKETKTREVFRPSEKISEDLSVSFPIDI
ncbi:hypothetical protein [Thalassotalea aquiviva]|uniref:hypothetical protein n=1 Tax=Thalassotalea aquiviva TaxID=3242415 RepID=UPI00352A5125